MHSRFRKQSDCDSDENRWTVILTNVFVCRVVVPELHGKDMLIKVSIENK